MRYLLNRNNVVDSITEYVHNSYDFPRNKSLLAIYFTTCDCRDCLEEYREWNYIASHYSSEIEVIALIKDCNDMVINDASDLLLSFNSYSINFNSYLIRGLANPIKVLYNRDGRISLIVSGSPNEITQVELKNMLSHYIY